MSDSCKPMDCSLPGSSVHGIFQARVLEWGAFAFSVIKSIPKKKKCKKAKLLSEEALQIAEKREVKGKREREKKVSQGFPAIFCQPMTE